MAPYMAPLVMYYELFPNRSWGWSSGIVGVPLVARREFESACNDYFYFCACFDRRNSYVVFL